MGTGPDDWLCFLGHPSVWLVMLLATLHELADRSAGCSYKTDLYPKTNHITKKHSKTYESRCLHATAITKAGLPRITIRLTTTYERNLV